MNIEDHYIPQVGDRVRAGDEIVIVLGVDDDVAWVKWEDDNYGRRYPTIMFVKHLVKVAPPVVYPERWLNVYPHYVASKGWVTRAEADSVTGASIRIAVIHLDTDGTLTLHPVERDQ